MGLANLSTGASPRSAGSTSPSLTRASSSFGPPQRSTDALQVSSARDRWRRFGPHPLPRRLDHRRLGRRAQARRRPDRRQSALAGCAAADPVSAFTRSPTTFPMPRPATPGSSMAAVARSCRAWWTLVRTETRPQPADPLRHALYLDQRPEPRRSGDDGHRGAHAVQRP